MLRARSQILLVGWDVDTRIALVENEQRLKQAMNNLERALVPRPPKQKKRQAATA